MSKGPISAGPIPAGPIPAGRASTGLRIPRRFTEEGGDPYESIEWARRDSRITNPDGSVVFEVKDAEVPAFWSQVATDIIVSKYFRKAGVPQVDDAGKPILDEGGNPVLGSENSSRQVFDRLATTWRWWGEKHGYFTTPADAQAYEDEMKYMLANQIASPNSPQWFNTGLAHAYGITGTPQGFWFVDPETGEMTESPDSYTHPAPHACFPAGARITTREGFKFIEKIEPGDVVLTHQGRYRTVASTMQRQIDEDLVTLSVSRLKGERFSATANHPILAVRRSDAKAGSRNPAWIRAGDLNVGDFVIVARPTSSASIPLPFDLATYAGPNFEVTDEQLITRNSGHRPTMSRFVEFDDPGLFRLLGHWLGDGSIGHETRDGELSSVNFVFRGDDLPSQQDVLGLMGKHFGVQAPVEFAKGQNTAHLRFVRRPLARFFADTFGFGFAGKALPGFVYDLPRSHRLELLVGLFKSDGCTLTVKNAKLICFDQSNQSLAEGIWRLLRSLGYAPSITGGKIRPGGTVPHFRVTVSVKEATDLAALCGVEVPESPMNDRFLRLGDDVGYRIQGIDRVPFYGTVYNFEVEEDESYVANGVVVHNCFINGVSDDLVNPGGIMDLWVREARLFKMGSGTGSNFSQIRAENEKLSGGGKSSGVMGFLRIGDRAAGAIKSGGTTRRAAKMVILDLDHPDIEEFIDWKKHEEEKARVLIQYGGYPADFNGEAYSTVSGQNSNNSVRVPNEFIEAVRNDGDWELRERTNGKVRKTMKARDLWRKVAEAAWACADPGVQFDTIINEWHTSPAGGKIRATNPCSEYVFLDNTACNLASINLVKFFDDATNAFDTEGYEHAIRLWTITLEISVTMAHFPSKEIAQGSYDYRTLGLGYANLGTLLMRMGLPYDSDAGRAVSGAITAILTGYAYATSAELAAVVGPFPRFTENREAMLRVVRNHRRAAYNTQQNEYEGLSHFVMGINPDRTPATLLTAARQSWDLALDMGERHGFRNAQVTVIAPTGCLVGGSLVPTERGLIRLGTLGDPDGSQWQDLGIKVGTDEGAKTASQFYINGVEPVVTVDTARGYRIQGTPTHRIKVMHPDGILVWKRFGEVTKDDLVPLQMNQLVGEPQDVDLPVVGRMTAELAEFIGIALRYGETTTGGFRFSMPDSSFEAAETTALLAKKLFDVAPRITDGNSAITVEFADVESLKVVAELVSNPQIPDAVLASNDAKIYQSFGRAFTGNSAVLDSNLAREVQTLLLTIGETSTLTPSGDGMELVVDQRLIRGDGGYLLDRVASAELGDEQWTYDLSVPENVTYVANGFVSHNTIGLQMDCDTTGVEPDFSLVKFKKLAGGGYFKIVNQSVTPALENLGYGDEQIDDIVRYIVGTSSLEGAPYINRESLVEKGFTAEDMVKIEATLPAVFELKHAFNPFVLGEATMRRLGFTPDEYATFEFDLLRALGFTNFEIREATEWVCGQQTIEGAPHLRDEHLAVFDTANRNGRNGQRLIHHTGHIKMLAAAQPFLSGAASKTINMPNEATIEDIEESYMMSYELGVKCMALYRDGSKASQPLSSSSDDGQSEEETEEITRAHEVDKQILWGKIPAGMSPTQAYAQGMHPPRFLLPGRRGGYTQEARIGGHKVYLRTGEYEDGTLGEVFIDLAKEGATLRGILSCFAIAVSKGLQFGVPLEEFVDTFTFQTFEPRGLVEGHPNIKMANSIVDYVFRALAVEYLKRDDLAQVPPIREGDLPEPASGLAVEAGVQLDLTDAVAEQDVSAVASAVRFLDQKPVAPVTAKPAPAPVAKAAVTVGARDAGAAAMQSALGEMMGDAPLCDICGHITIRNGSCYKCLNCGNSLGCS